MSENNKSPIHVDLESDDSSETEAEIPSISEQPTPTSNTGQPEKPLEGMETVKKMACTQSEISTPPTSLLLPPSTHQGGHSLPTKPKTTALESLPQTSRSKSENEKSPIHLELGSDESSSETEAEIPPIPAKPPQTTSTSNAEQPEDLLKDTKTTHKLIDNTSSAVAHPLSPVLLPVHQHGQSLPTESTMTTMESVPPTSRSESPRKVKQSHEDFDQSLIDQVQNLGLGAKMIRPECLSKRPPYFKTKENKDQTWALPFRVRKTGLISVWNVPDEDLVPTLRTQQAIQGTSIPQQYEGAYQGTLSNLQCQQCQRAIEGATSEIQCRQCLGELQKVASAPQQIEGACGGGISDPQSEGACGGFTSDSHHYLEGATAALSEEEFPRSYSDFKATYERRNSVEHYIRMRHRQREGLPPHDKAFQGAPQEAFGDYGDYERRDSEEEYKRMHHLQQEILGALPTTQHDIFEEMRRAEFEIFAAMSRPGETFEDLRNPEQEILEAQHYDREMARLAARFGGAPLEETTSPWKPTEFLDQDTLYELWRPPPDPVEEDEDMSPETRRRYELGRMALMRKPRENVEEMIEQKNDESEDYSKDRSGDEDTEYSEESLPSGSTD